MSIDMLVNMALIASFAIFCLSIMKNATKAIKTTADGYANTIRDRFAHLNKSIDDITKALHQAKANEGEIKTMIDRIKADHEQRLMIQKQGLEDTHTQQIRNRRLSFIKNIKQQHDQQIKELYNQISNDFKKKFIYFLKTTPKAQDQVDLHHLK